MARDRCALVKWRARAHSLVVPSPISRSATARGRRVEAAATRRVAIALAALAALAAAALSVAIWYAPARGLPGGSRSLARALNYPRFRWHARPLPPPHPVELRFTLPVARPRRTDNLVTLMRGPQTVAAVSMEYLDDYRVRLAYTERAAHGALPPAVVLEVPPETPQVLRLAIGGPYAEFDGQRSRLRAQLNGRPLWDAPAVSLAAFPARLRLILAREFAGTLESAHAIGQSLLAPPSLGGARLRLKLSPPMAGRSFPLVASGRHGAGDVLFLRVHAGGRVTFGYDHWGDPPLLSPETEYGFEQERVIEFWIPAAGRELVVKLDGRMVWRRPAAAYPTSPATLFIGANPIGATSCAPALEHAVIEARELPPPLP